MTQICAEVGNVLEKIDTRLDGFFRLSPKIGLALTVLIILQFLGILVSRLARSRAPKRDLVSLGEVAGLLLR